MSARSDIPKRLIYTCNCGWIDKGHSLGQGTARPYVGQKSLWDQIQSGDQEGSASTRSKQEDGFLVISIQDVGTVQKIGDYRIPIVIPFVNQKYFVKSGLTSDQKRSVAVAILREVSTLFEQFQLDYTSRFSDSGFSAEDLVSNLVGLYKYIRPQSNPVDVEGQPIYDPYDPRGERRTPIDYYLHWCKPVSAEASQSIWDKWGPVGASYNKNHEFSPKYFPCKECDGNQDIYFGTMFDIAPATKGIAGGSIFRDWTEQDDFTPEELREFARYTLLGRLYP